MSSKQPATNTESTFMTTDDNMEYELLVDYTQFAVRINTDTILTILQEAKTSDDATRQKRLVTAGLQLPYTSFEDFAILLHAILQRKKNNTFLQVTLSGEGQHLGNTTFPNILKKDCPATALFTELGLTSINAATLQPIGYDVTEKTLDHCFSDFAASIKQLATYADDYNKLKNRVKHGKAVWGLAFGLTDTDDVAHLDYQAHESETKVGWQKTTASIEQLDVAAITTAKIVTRTLDLLSMFVIHYHHEHADDYVYLAKEIGEQIIAQCDVAGLKSAGLTLPGVDT